MLNSDYALVVNQRTHHTEDRLNGIKELTIISGNSEILTKVPDNFDRDTHTQKINIDGSSFMLHNHKIINFNGEHIGHYLTIIDLSSLRNKQNSFIVYLCVITGIVILISVAVLYSGFDRILTRIENMSFELEKNVNRRTKELNDENKILKIENLELKEKYNEFLYMFENHKYIMALIDSATGNIIYANKAALDFLNTDDTENTLNIKSVIPVNEDYLIEKLKIASVEGFSNFETKFTDSEGNMYDFCIEGSPVEFKDKKLVFAVCRDITKDKKERENRIEIAEVLNHELATEKARRKELESILSHQAKMSALGEMLESIIHQWRQPLTAISLLMQDIEDTIQTEGKIGHDYLMGLSKEAMDQLTYMNTTIDDFRNFAKPSEDLSFFNPAEAITNISKMLIKQLIQSGIELNLKFKNIHNEVLQISNADHNSLYVPRDYSSTCKIEGYENEFKQTFLNILNNAKEALQAAQKKNGYFKGIIDINAYCDNNDIVIEISDNAGGIPQEILQDIFEPYFTTKENSGTGIGLYISKTIVEKHMKGKLTAENNDKGALFKIRLPLKLD
jgi:signal transduction histidine kinase